MIKEILYHIVDNYYPRENKVDLKQLYIDNTQEFEHFFLEDFIGSIPKDIREPSISFLARGKDKLERWGMFMAYIIQGKIEMEPEKIRERQGMLLMLKLLMVHVKQAIPGTIKKEEADGTPIEEEKDYIKEAEEAFEGLRTLQKKTDVV